jgi:hypothetical protein
MSLHVAAKHLASKGRDGDTELVHMTKGEIKGLQGLALAAGGSLSVNPDTGLVEASFLKNLLPMIAGAGLAMIPGVGPLAAAGMVGGFETVRTGDIGKGLMAGLGAYGGAGLAGGISSAGASSIADAGGSAAVDQLGSQATNLSADQLSNLSAEQLQGLKSVSDSGMYNTADVLKTANAANANTGAQNLLGAQNFPNLNASQLQGYSDALNSGAYSPQDIMRSAGAQNATAGASGMQTAGAGLKAGPSAIYDAMPTGTMMGLGATAANMLTPEAPPIPGQPEEDPRYAGSPYRYNLASGFQGSTPARPNPYYRPTGLGYAEGGDVMQAAGGAYVDEPMGDVAGMAAGGIAGYAAGGLKMKTMSLGEGMYRDTDTDTASLNAFEAAKKRMAKVNKAANMPKNYAAKLPEVRGLGELAMAQGGSLGGYSDGGRMLKGPGDGMSDSIPAMIGKRQPARLADGEFVVPADVVSHLGNGSTDAGAKKLYGMMDKIRKARTGKKKQAPAVKADKYMPA